MKWYELKQQSEITDNYKLELEDLRNVEDEDNIEFYKNEYGEYGLQFYKPNEIEPYYEFVL